MKTTNNSQTLRLACPVAEEIQLLADGRLDHESRTRLLRRIDASEEPHWRELALALVERDVVRDALQLEQPVAVAPAARGRRSPLLLAVAACVALGCFFLGWQMKPAAESSADAVVTVDSPKPLVLDEEEPEPQTIASIVAQANRQLAPTGYQASLFTRLVKTSLEDGREVMIPVSQVVLDHRGL